MMTKNVGLRIRVEHALRDNFLKICRVQDKPAAQVLREFMRQYVAEHSADTEGAALRTHERTVNLGEASLKASDTGKIA